MSETTGKKKPTRISVSKKRKKKKSHWLCCMQASSICTKQSTPMATGSTGRGEKNPAAMEKLHIKY